MAPKQELYSNAAPLVGKLHPFILAAFPPIGLPRAARPAPRIVQLNERARSRERGGASRYGLAPREGGGHTAAPKARDEGTRPKTTKGGVIWRIRLQTRAE